MLIKIISVVIFSILSAVLYRLGGWGDEGRKQYPKAPKWLFDTKARDIGCPLVCFFTMLVLGFNVSLWIHFICFLMLFGFLTTYWDFAFGYDNFWVHGFACGLAYLPYAIETGDWIQIISRAIFLAVFMGGLSAISSNDVVEETGRGGCLPATLPFLTI